MRDRKRVSRRPGCPADVVTLPGQVRLIRTDHNLYTHRRAEVDGCGAVHPPISGVGAGRGWCSQLHAESRLTIGRDWICQRQICIGCTHPVAASRKIQRVTISSGRPCRCPSVAKRPGLCEDLPWTHHRAIGNSLRDEGRTIGGVGALSA